MRPVQAVLGLLVLLVGVSIHETELVIGLTIWPHDVAKTIHFHVILEPIPRAVASFFVLVSVLVVTKALIAIVITYSILVFSVLAFIEVDLDFL